jgi:N-acetylmuramoyl-L-alanine amidase
VKKLISALLCIILLINAMPIVNAEAVKADPPTDGTTPYFARAVMLAKNADLYQHPQVEDFLAGSFLSENTINIVGKAENNWYKVTYGTDYLFIQGERITITNVIKKPDIDEGKLPCNSNGTLTAAQDVFDAPSVNGEVLASLNKGESVHLTYRLPNGWFKLEEGYIPEASVKNLIASDFVNDTGTITVLLDAGHGGVDSGAVNDDLKIRESDINLKVARYTKEELERYADVNVIMARTEDKLVMMEDRFKLAFENHADIYFCQHFNAGGGRGAEMYVSKEERFAPRTLAANVIDELNKLGIAKGGIRTRDMEGAPKLDYYKFIRWAAASGINAMLVEHCYMDSADSKYIVSEASLKRIGIADATAIAKTYGLRIKRPLVSIGFEKDEIIMPEGHNISLQPLFNPEDTTETKELKWSSSDPASVDVFDGRIVAKSEGEAIITIKHVKGLTASVLVRVKANLKDLPITRQIYNNLPKLPRDMVNQGRGQQTENLIIVKGSGLIDVIRAVPEARKANAPILLISRYGSAVQEYTEKAHVKKVIYFN